MAQEAEGEVIVPATLQALLAARLDQLESGERSVLERGSIEGEIFHRGAVQALAPEEMQVTPRLAALVRKELIRPNRPQLAREDGFRFRHLLIRDAAYDALPKTLRADLHHRLATWLEEHGTELVELDEIVGYHLEQACRYRDELGASLRREAASRRRDAAWRPPVVRGTRRADYRRRRRACSNARLALMVTRRRSTSRSRRSRQSTPCSGAAGADEALHRADAGGERASCAGDRAGSCAGNCRSGASRGPPPTPRARGSG